MTLTDLWVRVMETGAKGIGFCGFGWFVVYLLMDKRSGQRKTLWTLAAAWVMVGAGSLNTSLCIYLIKPVWTAYGNLMPAAVVLLMAVWLVLKSSELRQAWILWSELLRCADDEGDERVEIRVRKKRDGVWARLIRKRESNVATNRAVGRSGI